MDSKIKRFLNADEKVLWESRPQKVSLTEAPHIFIAILRWVISIAIVVFAANILYTHNQWKLNSQNQHLYAQS